MLLRNRVAIITGAGRGIGRAHALAFAAAGARVVVNDLGVARDGTGADVSLANTVAEEIIAAGGEAMGHGESVTSREGVDSLVWTALNRFGRIDVLVNNAGILRDRSLLKMSEREWDDVIAVHLRGSFLTTQAVARVMKQQGDGGRIINTTSVSGLLGAFGQSNYAAAKMGIAGLTFTAAKELARAKVTVNAIAPIALTRMTEDLPRRADGERFGPEYISPVALFLASDLAADITGKIFGVEGPRVFEYRVDVGGGITIAGDQPATPAILAERIGEILA